MAATKTSYIDANGNKQIGYIVNGSTFTDEAGTNPVGTGSIVTAGNQQWVKGVGENGASMLYSDYLKQNGLSATTYTDPYGQMKNGYIKNGVTYADILAQNEVGKGSIVTSGNGQQWVKGVGENGASMLYSDYLKTLTDQNATPDYSSYDKMLAEAQAAYDAVMGRQNDYSAYNKMLAEAQAAYDAVMGRQNDYSAYDKMLAEAQAAYDAVMGRQNDYSSYDQQMENAKAVYEAIINREADYSAYDRMMAEAKAAYEQAMANGGDTSALEQMLTDAEEAYAQAIAANDQIYAAQMAQSAKTIKAQIDKLNVGYKDLNTQLYRDLMTSRKNLPQVLAAQGITGGMSESALLGLETGYQGQLATNERERLSGISDIELSGSEAELQLAIEKARSDAEAGDVRAERRLAILEAMQEQRNLEQSRKDQASNTYTERQLAIMQALEAQKASDQRQKDEASVSYAEAQNAIMQALEERKAYDQSVKDSAADSYTERYMAIMQALEEQKAYDQSVKDSAADSYTERYMAIMQALEEQKAYDQSVKDSAASSYTDRYLEILQALEDQKAYDQTRADELTAANQEMLYAQALARAETMASIGDFSAYKALGYSDSEIAALQSAWNAKNGGYSGGGGGGYGSPAQPSMEVSNIQKSISSGKFATAASLIEYYRKSGRITEAEANYLLAQAGA